VPHEWRCAFVTPILKKGISSEPNNYRPISLTSVGCKLMESILKCDMSDYLLKHNLISQHQHGFLSKHSTCTQLLECVNDWTLNIKNKVSTDIIYVDFAKAFDSVCHSKLLIKLQAYGFRGNLLNWIAAFLSNRSQAVQIDGVYSDLVYMTSGVPQGSVLGPLLFLIYINDVSDIFSNDVKLKLYADDLKVYTTVDSHLEYEVLQGKLKLLESWSDMWQLKFSVSKCKHLRISQNSHASYCYTLLGNELESVPECVDLGVTVDDRLRFHSHIRSIATKAHQRANMILRCFLTRDINCLIKAFTVYVRPIIEYCSSVWSPTYKKDIELLEKVQRRFTKRLPGMKRLSYLERLANLNLTTLEARRLHIDLCLCYRIVNGLVDTNLSDMFTFAADCGSTRGHPLKLVKPHARVNSRMFFFSVRIVDVWNSLPVNVVTANTYRQFKCGIANVNLDKFLSCNLVSGANFSDD
jgi:hypothetical protein